MNEASKLSSAAKKAHRLGLATIDMQEVIDYLIAYDQLFIEQRKETNEWFYACKGLLCAAIVAYCRPFGGNKSKGFADDRLDPDDLLSVSDRESLHKLLIEKRNTFIAHSDWSARSAQILQAEESMVSWRFPQPNVWEGLDVEEFRKLASDVLRECMDRGLELANAARQLGQENDSIVKDH